MRYLFAAVANAHQASDAHRSLATSAL